MAEGKRYNELLLLEKAKQIHSLTLQPSYHIIINGHKICRVVLDFEYVTANGEKVIEDVKGRDNAVSKLKRKMVEAAYGFKVSIIK
jgi:hypothetical protein